VLRLFLQSGDLAELLELLAHLISLERFHKIRIAAIFDCLDDAFLVAQRRDHENACSMLFGDSLQQFICPYFPENGMAAHFRNHEIQKNHLIRGMLLVGSHEHAQGFFAIDRNMDFPVFQDYTLQNQPACIIIFKDKCLHRVIAIGLLVPLFASNILQ